MISILFVDDDANLRATLQRMLRSRHDRWSMRFAESGEQALEMIRSEPVDVVVSDIQMPGMNGADLLARIRRDYPDTILVILSGQCDRRTALRTVDPAHIYLAKPCDCESLVNAIERAYRLRSMLSERQVTPQTQDRVGGSPIYAALVHMLRDPDVAITEVADLMARDDTLTTRILQLVNSAFFGTSWRICDPLQAIRLLGLDLVRSVVLDIARSIAPKPDVVARAGEIGAVAPIGNAAETGLAIIDAETLQVRLANDAYRRMTGADGSICGALETGNEPAILRAARDGRDIRTSVGSPGPGGKTAWSDISISPLLDGSGRLSLLLCTRACLSPSDAATCDALGAQAPIMFDGLGEGVLVLDANGRIMAVNPGFEAISNYSPAEVVGQTLDFLSSPLHGPEFYSERERAVVETGYWRGEAWHRLRNGLSVPHFLTIAVADAGEGQRRHRVVTFRTALKKRDLERLRFLSNRDALTGLSNRAAFEEEVSAAVVRAKLSGASLAILAIRLDRLKLTTDSLGAQAVDRLLCEQAARLRDYIGDRGLAGGGAHGEFLLLIEDLRSAEEANAFTKQVAAELSRPISLEGHEVCAGVTIGYGWFPDDGDDAPSILANARAALLEPEHHGEAWSVRRFVREINTQSIARFTIGNQLRRALDRGELEVHYQPKVGARTGRVTGLEALVRWRRPEEGFVSPTLFIPVAEEMGLIEPIGEWVLHTACRDMRAWQSAGIAPARVAVNFSPHQFRQAHLLDRVVRVLEATGLPPTAFEIEITEGSTMTNPEAAITLMAALHEMGIALSIDDFGTGYSSLTYLKRFPIDAIKIDQSFVRGLPHDQSDIAIVNTIIALAKSLRLKLVAEGVETPAQRAFLVERGCDELQGYLFSHPRNRSEIEAMLDAQAAETPRPRKVVA